MLEFLTPRPSAARAAGILREVFGSIQAPFAFRLWDGQEVRLGGGEPVCTAVIKSPEIFLRLIRAPTPSGGEGSELPLPSRESVRGSKLPLPSGESVRGSKLPLPSGESVRGSKLPLPSRESVRGSKLPLPSGGSVGV